MFSRLFARRKPAAAPAARRPSFAPQLTALEDREVPAVYTVTNTSGNINTPGSLPWAVNQANYVTKGGNTTDYIQFNIPGNGRHVINLTGTIWVNDRVVIDATTEPGYTSSTPLISVQGNASVPTIFQLHADPGNGITSSGSTIMGFEITNFTSVGVAVTNGGTQGNWIQYNHIGFARTSPTSVTKTTATFAPPTYHPIGVALQSSFNVIRGNTIAGVYNGVAIGEAVEGSYSGTQYKTNSVQGNKIGTDPTGNTMTNYGTLSDGVFLGAGARENWLGPNNVVSGNASAGFELFHSTVVGNVVFQNKIGTNVDASGAIGNGELGVLLANGASGNAIGGPWGGNHISGNALGGVSIGTPAYPGGSGNWVQENVMGLNAAQTAVIGTQNVGVAISDGPTYNVIEANVIGGMAQHGVIIRDAVNNAVKANHLGRSYAGTIFANGANGICLLAGASYGWIQSNIYGVNNLGPIYVAPTAVGNSIT